MKYGRRDPKNAPALKLAPLLTGTAPTHPAAADTFTALNGGWQMLGNDQYGDCVAVTWANFRRVMTHQASAEKYPVMAEVETVYKTQNPDFPSEDNGMDIQTCLEYLVKSGGPDGTKALAFAKVDYTNPDEVKAALSIFGALWVGINVLDVNQTEFSDGQPWDYSAKAKLDGGHSIIVGGYGAPGAGPLGGDERFITWAAETSFTDAFWQHQVEEVWVVVWPEHLTSPAFQEGVNLTQLAADYQAITGDTFPVPEPAPTPQPPAPTPGPTPEPVPPVTPPAPTPEPNSVNDTLAEAAMGWVELRHVGVNRIMQRALRVWLVADGYVTGAQATEFSVKNNTESLEDGALGR